MARPTNPGYEQCLRRYGISAEWHRLRAPMPVIRFYERTVWRPVRQSVLRRLLVAAVGGVYRRLR